LVTMSTDISNSKPDNVRLAESIYTKYGPFIRAVINCRVKDQHLRNDIYHDFFLSLVRNPIPDNVKDIRNYIYKSICNDIRDTKRKSDCYYRHLQGHYQIAANSQQVSANESNIVEMEEVCRMLEAIEGHLYTSEAKVLKLRYQNDLTNSEIAKRMNLGHATVETYMSTALKKLRGILNQEKEKKAYG